MKYYCIGIKGTGMSTLAQILSDLGHEVTGYDDYEGYKFTEDGLKKRNIKIYYDHDHTIPKDTIVTYSVAFNLDHPEMKRVKELGLTIKKYNEIMGELTKKFETIGVSGTHGKTTTSSLIRHMLEETIGCNYFIGAGDGKVSKDNKYFVVESDEFNKHFTTYYPAYSVITNIEKEHMECYKDLTDIINTFEIFANHTKNLIVANGDNENVRKINYSSKVIFFGEDSHNDVVIKNIELLETGSAFDLYFNDELFGHFMIPLYGKHMIMDATAAIIIVKELGLKEDTINSLLKTFKNAKQRFEESTIDDTIIIDDYAHHPTEINVTLTAVKQKYPHKKIVVVFIPNTYSRTKDFRGDFIKSLSIADKVYLTEIDSNREKQTDYPGITSHLITAYIPNSEIISLDTINNLRKEKGNVICFMSCASKQKLIDAFKKIISD